MIRSKSEWYRLFHGPQFNRTRSYSLADFMWIESIFSDDKIFCFRNPSVVGAKFVCMPKHEIISKIMVGEFVKPYIVSEQAPDKHIVVQGEYDGCCAEVSFKKTPMRFALQQERIHMSRTAFIGLVGYERYRYIDDVHQQYYDGNDLNNRPVVEFSVYDRRVGCFHKDVIIWEVRNY